MSLEKLTQDPQIEEQLRLCEKKNQLKLLPITNVIEESPNLYKSKRRIYSKQSFKMKIKKACFHCHKLDTSRKIVACIRKKKENKENDLTTTREVCFK